MVFYLLVNYLPDIRIKERKYLEVSCFSLGLNGNTIILSPLIVSMVIFIAHTSLGLPLNSAQVSVQLLCIFHYHIYINIVHLKLALNELCYSS